MTRRYNRVRKEGWNEVKRERGGEKESKRRKNWGRKDVGGKKEKKEM